MKESEIDIVEGVAEAILGTAAIATVTAGTLKSRGINPEELAVLVLKYSGLPRDRRRYDIKRNLAGPETPADFGLLLRRITGETTRGSESPTGR